MKKDRTEAEVDGQFSTESESFGSFGEKESESVASFREKENVVSSTEIRKRGKQLD